MTAFRGDITSIGGIKISQILDYSVGIGGLPKSNVIKFLLSGGSTVVVRPSGTEPKLKTYISIIAESNDKAAFIEKRVTEHLERIINGDY